MSNSFFNHNNRFVKLDTVRASDTNNVFDQVVAGFDGVETKTNAALKLPDGESASALPVSGTRANKVLTFDGSGNPVATHAIADVTTVAGIAGDVTTVAGIDTEIVSVAGNAANINTVAGNSANVTTVAGVSGNVTTVATNIANVNTAATNIAAIIDAPNQASAAAASAASAATLYDSFDDRYLGPKAVQPTLDNDGNPLITGALYFHTAGINPGFRVYDGANWIEPAGSISPDFTVIREVKTATAGQTVFVLDNTYTVGNNSIMIYQNGSRLISVDYTETNSNTITLATGATLGDEFLFEIGVVATGTTVAAGNVSFNPSGTIASTNVQAAITELDQRVTDLPPSYPFSNSTSLAQAQAIALCF